MEVGAILGPAPQRVLAAIVFTDAVDFSARIGENEERTVELIREDLDHMRDVCREFDGQVVKSRGDGLMILFTSAVQAVSCAVEIQRSFADRIKADPKQDRLSHRIGIHLGDVLISDGDALGDGVNVAARLEEEAEPGGICMSQTVYDVVKNRLFLQATKLGELKLRNIAEPVLAYKIAGVGRSRRHHYAKPHWASLAVAGVLLLLVGIGGTTWYYRGKIGQAQAAEQRKQDETKNDGFFHPGELTIPMPPMVFDPMDKKTTKRYETLGNDWAKWAEDVKRRNQDFTKVNTKDLSGKIQNELGSAHAGHPNDTLPQSPQSPNPPEANSIGG